MTNRRPQHHLKGKIRDKVKQVILINGIPKVLYTLRKSRTASITFNGKKFRLDIPAELIEEFKKLPTLEIKESIRTSKQFNRIPIKGLGHRTSIRAVNGNAHITVGGSDEAQLAERIEIVKEYLISLGINSIGRCHWTCTTDKAKPNTDYQYPHKDPEPEQLKPIEPVMSEKTKSLRDIAIKSIKEVKA